MDPISMITAALVSGVVAAAGSTASQAVQDLYAGLKALIVRRFGDRAEVKEAIDKVEKDPQSNGRKEVLKEELQKAGADKDAEVQAAAIKLLDLLKAQGVLGGATNQAWVTGTGNVVAQDHSAAATHGSVAIGGNVEGGVHMGKGDAKEELDPSPGGRRR